MSRPECPEEGPSAQPASSAPHRSRAVPLPARLAAATGARKVLYLILGALCVALGLVGAFLPVMPTTLFLILAAWCFARSSPRLHARLLSDPRVGPALRDWEQHGAISRRGKAAACMGMAIGYLLFWWSMRPQAWLALLVAAGFIGCAAYVLRRPSP